MDINYYINSLVEKQCWSVIAGSGTGSVVNLGFGEKKLRKRTLNNIHLSQDERTFKPEISLMIHCAWRLSKSNEILCSWRDSNELEGDMLKGLNLLRNKKITDVYLRPITYDLDIHLNDSICFQVFCDQTNDYDSDENYTLFANNNTYTVGLKSNLEIEYY